MNKTLATILTGGLILGGTAMVQATPTVRVHKNLYTSEQYKVLKHDVVLEAEAKMLSGQVMSYKEARQLIDIYNIENKKNKYNLAGSGRIDEKIIRAMAFRERNEK